MPFVRVLNESFIPLRLATRRSPIGLLVLVGLLGLAGFLAWTARLGRATSLWLAPASSLKQICDWNK